MTNPTKQSNWADPEEDKSVKTTGPIPHGVYKVKLKVTSYARKYIDLDQGRIRIRPP
ncbi:MAG: hypothetical protein R2788_18210 [Saprospiraceae bacterium]